jgi:predicted RNA binding protein YcfA (HicA-like mRNA interferase family)
MPKKIRQLKSMLLKAGFVCRPGKGSHTSWTHPGLPGKALTLSGHDGDDARHYQEIFDLRPPHLPRLVTKL